MKKLVIGCTLALVLLAGVCVASSTSANFSGTWVLDKSKSDGLPPQWQNIESLTMVVTQDDKLLTVESKVVAGTRAPGEQTGDTGQGAGRRAGGGMGNGRRQGGFGGQGGRGGFGLGMPSASYKLDGTETKIESAGGRGGEATLKARWKSDGKVLELTNTRNVNFQGNEITRTTTERWELTDGGKSLKVKRTTEGRQGSQESTLVFNKQ